MAQTTKRTLAASLKKLLESRALDGITVKDLVEDCGVNRQTFYYHFQDIYDLLRWVFEEEAAALLEGKGDADTWQQGYLEAFRYVRRHRAMILHVYRSTGGAHLDAYLNAMVRSALRRVVEESARGLSVSDGDKAFLADFYRYAFVGLMQDWIAGGMAEEPEALVGKVARLIEGDFRRGLERFAR